MFTRSDMKITIAFTFFILALSECKPQKCDITRECPPSDEEMTWATDGKLCHVFRNRCYMENTICHQELSGDPEYKEITKESCQALCVTKCEADDNPVCGYYNDLRYTFANQCEMESHICRTGETIFYYGIGPCD